jgi:hypothetical protein
MDQVKGISMKNGLEIDKNGNKFYYKDDQLHREDGPAVEYTNGTKWWYINVWYINGKIHRDDGPAVEYVYGDKEWWYHGKLHRINGPAVETSNGHKEWFYHGKYVNCYSQQEFEQWLRFRVFL